MAHGSRRSLIVVPDVAGLAPFAGCTRAELARIRSLLTAILLPVGHTVIECGAPPRQFAVIADGEVVVEDRRGRELNVLGPGSIVGELGILHDVPAGATVRTLTPVIAYVGNRSEFEAMLSVAPTVDHHVLHVAIDRLRRRAAS